MLTLLALKEMRHRIITFSMLFLAVEVIVSCDDKNADPNTDPTGVVRVSAVTPFSPEVLSTDEVKWEGEKLTLRFADRVDGEFLRIYGPSGDSLYFGYFGPHQTSLWYVYANGEIFGFHFWSPQRMLVLPTLRSNERDQSTSPAGPNMESWREFEALMEKGLAEHPQSTGNSFPESAFTVRMPRSLTEVPSDFGSDVMDARIFSTSMESEKLLVDYEVPEFRLKGRLEIDVKVRPWKILRAWKNGVPIDLEADLYQKNQTFGKKTAARP